MARLIIHSVCATVVLLVFVDMHNGHRLHMMLHMFAFRRMLVDILAFGACCVHIRYQKAAESGMYMPPEQFAFH